MSMRADQSYSFTFEVAVMFQAMVPFGKEAPDETLQSAPYLEHLAHAIAAQQRRHAPRMKKVPRPRPVFDAVVHWKRATSKVCMQIKLDRHNRMETARHRVEARKREVVRARRRQRRPGRGRRSPPRVRPDRRSRRGGRRARRARAPRPSARGRRRRPTRHGSSRERSGASSGRGRTRQRPRACTTCTSAT